MPARVPVFPQRNVHRRPVGAPYRRCMAAMQPPAWSPGGRRPTLGDMDVEHNKAVVRRMFEVVLPAPTLGDELEQLVAPDFVDHGSGESEPSHGIEAVRATHEQLHRRYGDAVRFDIEEIIGEGDAVALRWKAGNARAIAWFRLRDGKIVERRAMIARR